MTLWFSVKITPAMCVISLHQHYITCTCYSFCEDNTSCNSNPVGDCYTACTKQNKKFKFNQSSEIKSSSMNLIAMIGLLSYVPLTFTLGKGPLKNDDSSCLLSVYPHCVKHI